MEPTGRNRVFIPKLNRVRKILAQVHQRSHTEVVCRLRKMLRRALDDFPEALRARHTHIESTKPGQGAQLLPDAYWRCTVEAPAAAYLLAELKSHDSLPAMCDMFASSGGRPWIDAHAKPIGPVFLFYAMHVLCVDHPTGRLRPGARKLLNDYLEIVKNMPVPIIADVPTWDAGFEETDFRVMIAGERRLLRNEPKFKMRFYPAELDKFEDFSGTPIGQVREKFTKLRAFVRAAYAP